MTGAAALYAPVALPAHPVHPLHSWWNFFQRHRDREMPRQSQSWTCSACAIDWVALATGLDPSSNREKVTGNIGYPECVNPTWGLMDSRCAVRVMHAWGVGVELEWVQSWERAVELFSTTTGIFNSTIWYHFVGMRGLTEDGLRLWVANSAPGYRNIWDEIDRTRFNAWAGSWKAIYLVR